MFFKNKKTESPACEYELQVRKMGEEIRELYCRKEQIEPGGLEELSRQTLSIYLFGMSNGLLLEGDGNCTSREAAAAMRAVLKTVFGYSGIQARKFVSQMISGLRSKDESNITYAIIHKGLAGYFAYKSGQIPEVIDDLIQIIATLQSGNSSAPMEIPPS